MSIIGDIHEEMNGRLLRRRLKAFYEVLDDDTAPQKKLDRVREIVDDIKKTGL